MFEGEDEDDNFGFRQVPFDIPIEHPVKIQVCCWIYKSGVQGLRPRQGKQLGSHCFMEMVFKAFRQNEITYKVSGYKEEI